MNDLLDEKDFIPDSYIFEVSSPGLGRQLKKDKDFARSIGSEVEGKLFRAVDKRKDFCGILSDFPYWFLQAARREFSIASSKISLLISFSFSIWFNASINSLLLSISITFSFPGWIIFYTGKVPDTAKKGSSLKSQFLTGLRQYCPSQSSSPARPAPQLQPLPRQKSAVPRKNPCAYPPHGTKRVWQRGKNTKRKQKN